MKIFINFLIKNSSCYIFATLIPLSAIITTGEIFLTVFSFSVFGLIHVLLIKHLISNVSQRFFQIFLAVASVYFLSQNLNWPILIFFFLIGVVAGQISWVLKPKFLLFLLITLFLFGSVLSFQQINQLVGHEPVSENYNHDSYIFLKTVYLMQEGKSYYQAFAEAVVLDVRAEAPPSDIFEYRLPTLFFIWSILPNPGVSLWVVFLILCSLMIVVSYKTAVRFSSPSMAILAPYLLVPYLLFASKSHWFLITEWWAMIFILLFLFFFLYRKERFAYIFMLLAFLSRELLTIPILANSIFALFLKSRRYLFFFLSILIVFFIFYLAHVYFIYQVGVNPLETSVNKLLSGSIGFLRTTLAFATQYYFSIQWGLQNMALYFLISILGLVLVLITNRKEKSSILISYLTCFSFPIAFLFIAVSRYNDYWGIMYVPLMLCLLPWSLESLNKVFVQRKF